MFNLWRQLRLAGSVVMVAGSWMRRLDLVLIGFTVVMIGTINGLARVENQLQDLEKGKTDEKTEA